MKPLPDGRAAEWAEARLDLPQAVLLRQIQATEVTAMAVVVDYSSYPCFLAVVAVDCSRFCY